MVKHLTVGRGKKRNTKTPQKKKFLHFTAICHIFQYMANLHFIMLIARVHAICLNG